MSSSASDARDVVDPVKGLIITSGGGSASTLRSLSMKEYASLHSRICNLIFVCILLGTVAGLCFVTSLNAYGYFTIAESRLFMPLLSGRSDGGEEVGALTSSGVVGNNSASVLVTNSSSVEVMPVNVSALSGVYHNMTSSGVAGDDSSSVLAPSSSSVEVMPLNMSALSDVYHNMTEEELLWRASGGRPRSVTPKVAFLFLARGPMPLAPLWERYFKGYVGLYSIYLHTHPNYRPDFPPDSVFYRRNIPSKEVFWGRITMYLAERRLLANALLDAANERFVHLSDACIPVTPFPVAYKYFTESEHSFVEVFEDPGSEGIGRYNRIRNAQKLNPEVSASQWRKGGQWFEMSRALAVMVIRETKYLPKFQTVLCMNDCVCYIEEHYLPTVLTILAAPKLANRTTTYVDFSQHGPHPKEFEPEEITEALLKTITTDGNCTYNGKATKTCRLFARKFSPRTIEPLLQLAATSFGIS